MNGIPQTYKSKPLVHEWPYFDRQGQTLGIVGRYQDGSGKKDIVPFFKRNGSTWATGAPAEPRPLFGLDRLAKQTKEKAVFIVEGEKAAAIAWPWCLCGHFTRRRKRARYDGLDTA